MTPELSAFFTTMGPYLQGRAPLDSVVDELGPLPGPAEDLAFYRYLVAFDQCRILGEIYGPVRAWIEATGRPFGELAEAYVQAHPPSTFSVVDVGDKFPGWLEAQPGMPTGAAAVADLLWTKLVARNAPDEPGVGMDRRVHFRQYPVDPVAILAALRASPGQTPPTTTATAWFIYRRVDAKAVCQMPATPAGLAALLPVAAPDLPVPAALAALPAEAVAEARRVLVARGLLP